MTTVAANVNNEMNFS